MDYSPPGSSVLGILQARILQWVAIPFSNGSSRASDQTWFSCTAGRFFNLSHQGVGNQNVKLQELLLVVCAFAGSLVCSSVNWAPALWSALPQGTRDTQCLRLSRALGGLLPTTQSVTQDALPKEAGGEGAGPGHWHN